MKKLSTLLLMMAIAVISSTFVPKAMAQDSTASKPEHVGPRKVQVLLSESPADIKRGYTTYFGATMKYGKGHSVNILASFAAPFSTSVVVNPTFTQSLSLGLSCTFFPLKGKFGKMWGFGLDGDRHFFCNVNVISMLQDGALFTDLLKGVGANWSNYLWAISPLADLSCPIGERIRIGFKIKPVPWGRFDDIHGSYGFTHAKQWLDIDLHVSIRLGKNGEAVANTKDAQPNSAPAPAPKQSSKLNLSDN